VCVFPECSVSRDILFPLHSSRKKSINTQTHTHTLVKMSIVTLKRKTEAKRSMSSGPGGFSLNNPRRVEAHTHEPATQTKMRGLGYKGYGGHHGRFVLNPVASQFVNFDPMTGPRESVKTNHGQLQLSYFFKTTYPYNVVQSTYQTFDYAQYLARLNANTTSADMKCSGTQLTVDTSTGTCSCDANGPASNYVKIEPMDYQRYYATHFLNKSGIPLTFERQHFPPPMSSHQGDSFVCGVKFDYATWLAKQLQKKTACNQQTT
jgi:hypothetical protein